MSRSIESQMWMYSSKIPVDEIMAVMIFSEDHIWCMKKYNEIWFHLDSLSNGPKPISFRHVFARQDVGRIIIWNESKSAVNNECIVLSPLSKGEQAVPVVTDQSVKVQSRRERAVPVVIDQSVKVQSRRASRRNRINEDLLLDQSFSSLDTGESNFSNRFEILSDQS